MMEWATGEGWGYRLGIRPTRHLYSHASQQGGLAVLLYDQETTAQKDQDHASIAAQGEHWSVGVAPNSSLGG